MMGRARAVRFGCHQVGSKATAFLGPFALGVLTTLFETQRAGVAVVLDFFAVGGVVLATVDEAAGIPGRVLAA